MNRVGFVALGALIAVWIIFPGDPATAQGDADRGQQLFEKHCSVCHGTDGRGDGSAAYLMSPKPRDFARGEFRLITTGNGVPAEDDLLRVVTNGMPGSAMPPWDRLSEADRRLLVQEVQRLWRDGLARIYRESGTDAEDVAEYVKEDTTPGATISFAGEAEPTLTDVARGRIVYSQACASCHGPGGRGESKEKLLDSLGWPAPARDFTKGIFKGGSEPRQLIARLRSGMKGTAMPTFTQEQLTQEEAWAVVHYVRTLAPPGAQERQSQKTQQLKVRRVPKLPSSAEEWWKAAPPAYVALMPLWWRDDRIENILFQVVHDGRTLALRLVWEDATQDLGNIHQDAFHDGAAVQLSWDADPPFFAMGDKSAPVLIWSWKASWQEDQDGYKDIESLYPHMHLDTYFPVQKNLKAGERPDPATVSAPHHDPTYLSGWGAGNPVSDPDRPSAVEVVRARGQGSLTTQERDAQTVRGKGVWDRGVWTLVIETEIAPDRLKSLFVALAAWNGSQNDRNGQKSVSIWHRLELE